MRMLGCMHGMCGGCVHCNLILDDDGCAGPAEPLVVGWLGQPLVPRSGPANRQLIHYNTVQYLPATTGNTPTYGHNHPQRRRSQGRAPGSPPSTFNYTQRRHNTIPSTALLRSRCPPASLPRLTSPPRFRSASSPRTFSALRTWRDTQSSRNSSRGEWWLGLPARAWQPPPTRCPAPLPCPPAGGPRSHGRRLQTPKCGVGSPQTATCLAGGGTCLAPRRPGAKEARAPPRWAAPVPPARKSRLPNDMLFWVSPGGLLRTHARHPSPTCLPARPGPPAVCPAAPLHPGRARSAGRRGRPRGA